MRMRLIYNIIEAPSQEKNPSLQMQKSALYENKDFYLFTFEHIFVQKHNNVCSQAYIANKKTRLQGLQMDKKSVFLCLKTTHNG